VVVEQFANSPARSFGDFACPLGGADAHVFARTRCALAHIAGSLGRVKRDKIASTFTGTLGRSPGALGGSFANIACTFADFAASAGLRTALMGLLTMLAVVGRLR
jgi:hypothetical protein